MSSPSFERRIAAALVDGDIKTPDIDTLISEAEASITRRPRGRSRAGEGARLSSATGATG